MPLAERWSLNAGGRHAPRSTESSSRSPTTTRSRPTLRPGSLRLRHAGERAPAVGDGAAGFPPRSSSSSPETKSAQRPKGAASSMRVRTSSPPSRGRSGRERRARPPRCVTPRTTSSLGGLPGPSHLAKGRRHAPFRPPSPQSFSEDSAPHWVHLQTSTSIKSSVCLDVLSPDQGRYGPQPRSAGLAMAYKFLRSAEDRWRSVNGSPLVALVRADATFQKGVLVGSHRETQGAAAWPAGPAEPQLVALSRRTPLIRPARHRSCRPLLRRGR